MTTKQKWVLKYLEGVTCASEHELAKEYAKATKGYSQPSQWDAFNMHTTLESLINKNLVYMERNPISRYRYYSLA